MKVARATEAGDPQTVRTAMVDIDAEICGIVARFFSTDFMSFASVHFPGVLADGEPSNTSC